MSHKPTKKELKRQSTGAGILLAVFVGFAAFALYQGIKTTNDAKKEVAKTTENSDQISNDNQVPASNTVENSNEKAKSKDVKSDNSNSNEKNPTPDTEQVIGGPTEVDEETESAQRAIASAVAQSNDAYHFSYSVPGGWTSHEDSPERIGLLPPGESASGEYQGDIVLTVKSNTDARSIEEAYNGTHDVALFDDALGGAHPLSINGHDAVMFYEVDGYVPANVMVINLGDSFLEITDVGMRHVSDGIFDIVANSIQ